MKYRFIVGIALLVVLFVIIASCFSKPGTISPEDHNINIVKLSYSAFKEGDWSSLADLYSPYYLQHSPDFKDPITWPEYELSCRIVHDRLPNLQYRIVDIFAFKDKVAVRSVWEYPRDPSWSRYRMSGIVLNGSAISIFRIKDRMIIEEWCEFDPSVIKKFCSVYKSMSPNK